MPDKKELQESFSFSPPVSAPKIGCCNTVHLRPSPPRGVGTPKTPEKPPTERTTVNLSTEDVNQTPRGPDTSTTITTRVVTSKFMDGEKKKTLVNDYVLISVIGRGALSTVKLAHLASDTKSAFAVKIYNRGFLQKRKPGGVDERTYYERVMREVELLLTLRHPNVVTLYELMNDPECSHLYLVFEYCSGGVLYRLDKDKPLKESVAQSKFFDVVKAVKFLHASHIVHRDLKPENFLVDEKANIVKVADFGSAETFDGEDDFLEDTAGTPAFWGPELFFEFEEQLPRGRPADMWALGICVYVVLFGKLPFKSASFPELQASVCNDRIDFASTTMSEAALHLLLGLLDKDPANRLSIDELYEHEWFESERNGGRVRHGSTPNYGTLKS